MDYDEHQPPSELAGLVKVAWTLKIDQSVDWVSHVAAPDGCAELIHRVAGYSHWQTPQPSEFVAGIVTQPAELRLSGGSEFVGLRLWPWTWNRMAPAYPAPSFINGWRSLTAAISDLRLPGQADRMFDLVSPNLLTGEERKLVGAILTSTSVAQLTAESGRSHRAVQRWFAQEVGLPPRTYLRLLRFNEALADLPEAEGTLADHAVAHGFADQAHMAREFRRMSSQPAVVARRTAKGPFLPGQDPL